MVKVSTLDIASIGLFFLSIYIFFTALNSTSTLIKLIGLISSIILFLSEGFFFIQIWRRR